MGSILGASPWVHTWPSPMKGRSLGPMKREMKGSFPAWEMGDEVLGSILGASPLGCKWWPSLGVK